MLLLHRRVRKSHFVEGRALLRRGTIQPWSLQRNAAFDIAVLTRSELG
jgi:hypothetical protein